MQSLQERVAYLEGRVTDNAALVGELRQDVRDLRVEIASLEIKIDRNFMWTMGAQLTTLLAVIGALLVPYFRAG